MRGLLGWLLQRISGVVLLWGLMVHFYVMHYSGEGVGYEAVLRRLSSPYWRAFDLVFLLTAVYHGFNGLWGIASEYLRPAGLLRVFRVFILAAALMLSALGTWLLTLP